MNGRGCRWIEVFVLWHPFSTSPSSLAIRHFSDSFSTISISPYSISSKTPDSPLAPPPVTTTSNAESRQAHLLRSPPTSPSTSTLSLPGSVATGGQQSAKGCLELYFVVKFYPEDITQELIQQITRHLFYLQVKQEILNMDIYCPPDTAAHLASLALQAKFGDYEYLLSSSDSVNLESEALLPLSCFQKVELSRSDWFDRIVALWRTHASLTREEAEIAYLKHAQDLDMFGLSFFEISKMQGAAKSSSSPSSAVSTTDQAPIAAELWLGIDSLGIRFYKKNKLRPEVFFSWCDIKSVTAHDKKVILNLTGDKNATFAFYAAKSTISREVNRSPLFHLNAKLLDSRSGDGKSRTVHATSTRTVDRNSTDETLRRTTSKSTRAHRDEQKKSILPFAIGETSNICPRTTITFASRKRTRWNWKKVSRLSGTNETSARNVGQWTRLSLSIDNPIGFF